MVCIAISSLGDVFHISLAVRATHNLGIVAELYGVEEDDDDGENEGEEEGGDEHGQRTRVDEVRVHSCHWATKGHSCSLSLRTGAGKRAESTPRPCGGRPPGRGG